MSSTLLANTEDTPSNSYADARVAQLISTQQWNELGALLTTEHGIRTALNVRYCEDGVTTALHLCCKHHATLNIVKQVVKNRPSDLLVFDGLGNTPLHVALKEGAPLHVVKFLLEKCPRAATLVDDRDRTPLILFSQNIYKEIQRSYEVFGKERGSVAKIVEIVDCLCAASLPSIDAQDSCGKTALQYVVEGSGSCELKEKILEPIIKAKSRNVVSQLSSRKLSLSIAQEFFGSFSREGRKQKLSIAAA